MTARSTPSRPVRRVAAACLLAVATLLAVPTAAPGQSWSDGACPDGGGVTVVVDFVGFRDEVVVRCAPSPASGYEALEQVGMSYTPTARFPGFLCRIEGYPADDPCQNTPPPDAYWEYWRAEHGGSWAYSQYGPATTSPPPGPVEGWRFSTGDDAPPRVAPPAARPAPEPEPEPEPTPADPSPTPAPSEPAPSEPTTTSPPPPREEDNSTDDGAASGPTTTEDDAPTATDATDATATHTPRTEDPAPGRTATPTSSAPTSTDDATETETPDDTAAMDVASAPRDDDGPPLGTLLGVGLVAVVGGAAVLVDRRRRQP